jgi:hypothetical protein
MIPKIYLISRSLTPEQLERVRRALSITPLAAVVVADARDLGFAKQFSENTGLIHDPIAILADFDEPLTALNEDGSICQVQ